MIDYQGKSMGLAARVSLFTFVCAIVLTYLIGCSSHQKGMGKQVFGDLAYVGAEAVSDNLTERDVLEKPVMPNGVPLPVPTSFVGGMQYRFICPEPCDVYALSMRVFPERLGNIGARVTQNPTSSDDLIQGFSGDPLFDIAFDWNGQKFRLINTPNRYVILQCLDDPKSGG